MRHLKNILAGVIAAMRKSIHSEPGASTQLTLASAQAIATARLGWFVRYVGLALYMVDPIHGVCDPELVSEYANGPSPKRELPQQRSPAYWSSTFVKAKTRKAEEGMWK
jgi:hypothetical protein